MNNQFMNIIYPQIEDEASAKRVAKFGASIALVIAAISLAMIGLNIFEKGTDNSIDIFSALIGNVAPMLIIAFFINKMSRVAAVIAILITAAEMYIKFTEQGTVGLTPFFILAFYNSARATFKYKNIKSKN